MSVRAIGMALEVTGISTRAKLVLIGLANCADDGTFECFPGRKHLAGVADCSVDTVDRAIRELAENHIIEVTHQWKGPEDRIPTVNSYRVFPWFDPSRRTAATPVGDSRKPAHTPSRSPAPTVAARDAATKEPSSNHVVVAASEWASRLKEAQSRAGDACNMTSGHVHHFADLRRLEEAGCEWEADILPAIDALAAGIIANKRKPLNSWAHPGLIDAATTLRDRRLAGLPAPQASKPNGASNGRHDARAAERAAWDAICGPVAGDAAGGPGPPVALGKA